MLLLPDTGDVEGVNYGVVQLIVPLGVDVDLVFLSHGWVGKGAGAKGKRAAWAQDLEWRGAALEVRPSRAPLLRIRT